MAVRPGGTTPQRSNLSRVEIAFSARSRGPSVTFGDTSPCLCIGMGRKGLRGDVGASTAAFASTRLTTDQARTAHDPPRAAAYVRFKGEPGEQATMFFFDPSGNAVELKAFADLASLFAK